nr:retrovirus-related Pol polyprotein from transposon TNT 1-94 [Tanacetum cinerariifolium]
MLPPNNLVPDELGVSVSEIQYKGMIESLMYLKASRPDIQLSICLRARYQANPKESHLVPVKRISMYPKGTPSLAKAKYVTIARCCAQVLWMNTQLADFEIHYDK